MSNQSTQSPQSLAIEQDLATAKPGGIADSFRRVASRQLADEGVAASDYRLWAVRSNELAGPEIFGPHRMDLGGYSTASLYGQHGSLAFRFSREIKRLARLSARWAKTEADSMEFAQRAILIWSDVGQLKDFLGADDAIDELIAVLRTARYQFLRLDTPPSVAVALAEVFAWISTAPLVNVALVDQMIDRLEAAEVDPFARDASDA